MHDGFAEGRVRPTRDDLSHVDLLPHLRPGCSTMDSEMPRKVPRPGWASYQW